MITRIEIDGFKSFLDFQLDVPPLLALVGPNASGKSNLLDAVSFVVAEGNHQGAGLLVAKRGRAHELLHRVAKGLPVEEATVTIEALVPSESGSTQLMRFDAAIRVDPTLGVPVPQVFSLSFLRSDAPNKAPVDQRFKQLGSLSSKDEYQRYVSMGDEERESWRLYTPDPQAMRASSSSADRRPLLADGGNLAAILGRMVGTDAFADLMVDLVALIPDVVSVKPCFDEHRGEWSFDLVVDGQGSIPSTLLSDGTLRILGLLAALHDPEHSGTLLVEEIENGLHPRRLAELLRRIQQRVTDISDPESMARPLRQVILTTHSPVVVAELYRFRPDSLVFLDTAIRVDPDNDRISRVTVAKPVRAEGEPGTFVSPRQVRLYLSSVGQPS